MESDGGAANPDRAVPPNSHRHQHRHDDEDRGSSPPSSGRSSPVARWHRGEGPPDKGILFVLAVAGNFLALVLFLFGISFVPGFLNLYLIRPALIPLCIQLLILRISWVLYPKFWTEDRVLAAQIFVCAMGLGVLIVIAQGARR
jgi:hypothetical protein